jgi:hypothetical protein
MAKRTVKLSVQSTTRSTAPTCCARLDSSMGCSTQVTCTSGLSARNVCAADATLVCPMRSLV